MYRKKKFEDGVFLDVTKGSFAYRAVNQSFDKLPGICVDVYGKYAFIHIYSSYWQMYIQDMVKSIQHNGVTPIDGVYIVDRTRKENPDQIQEVDPYKPLPILSQIFNSNYSSVCIGGRKARNHETIVEENGAKFWVKLDKGASIGLYLDQRFNRQRVLYLLESTITSKTKTFLNTFCYTCSFSLFLAMKGIQTTNIDASNIALNHAKRNFLLNGIDEKSHSFINSDVFTSLVKFNEEQKEFDGILLDPPTISHVKHKGGRKLTFSTNDNYSDLIALAASLVKPGGYIFAFVNTHSIEKGKWEEDIYEGIEHMRKTKFETLKTMRLEEIRKKLRKVGVKKKIRDRLLEKMNFEVPIDVVYDNYAFEKIEYLGQDIDFPYRSEDHGKYLHGIVLRRKLATIPITPPKMPDINDSMIHTNKLKKNEELKAKRQSRSKKKSAV